MGMTASRTGLSDTTPEAQAVLDDVYRRMPIEQKWRLLHQAQRRGKLLAEAGRQMRKPGSMSMSRSGEDVDVLRRVISALDKFGIAYALGGSMASSIYGVMRTTQDADLMVEPFPGREQALASCFDDRHFVSVAAIQEAIRRRTSFNIIDTTVGFKVDLFVQKDRPFEISAMSRRRPLTLPDCPEQPVFVLSPEDVVVFKLEWYRLGGEVSERQWLDVKNVLKAQAERLDRLYLANWACELGVLDLSAQAITESGING
jgi:hypothetical protein